MNETLSDVRAKILPLKVDELVMSEKQKKNGGSPTAFRREQARKSTLNLKNRALLANKATMSVSPKIKQLDL